MIHRSRGINPALAISNIHENKTLNNVVFILGGVLIIYTLYNLYQQNKVLSLQHQHMMMEMDKMQKEGISVPKT